MKHWFGVVSMMVVAACGSSNKATPDAAVDAAVDAHVFSGTAMVHVLYMNFEGATLMPGTDNATLDTSTLIATATTYPAFRATDAARATKIAMAVTELTTVLAPYDIDVVTTRPSQGTYAMMVVTDGPTPGCGGCSSVTPNVCNVELSPVAIISNTGNSLTTHLMISDAIGMFGIMANIPGSKQPGDCMCFGDIACTQPTVACTIGGPGTPVSTTAFGCTFSGTTMDEGALFLSAFGAHP